MSQRFAIRFDAGFRWLFTLLLLPPSASYVEVGADEVRVRMSWAFRARIPRWTVASVTPYGSPVFSWGVHGWAGRWLVNGSSRGILSVKLEPPARASMMGFPVRLKELLVSVEDPEGLAHALAPAAG